MKRRVLLVASEFPPGPGGIGHHAWFLVKELVKTNQLDVEVIAPADYVIEQDVIKFDSKQPFIIHRFRRFKYFTYFIRCFQLTNILFRNQYTHFWASGKFSLWMIWLQKVINPQAKSLCILHGSEVNLKNKGLRLLTHHSIFQYETVISVSRFTQSLLPNWILNQHIATKIIPNGLDITGINLNQSIQLHGFPKLLTVGHVSPRKGQHRLIRALPLIINKFPNIVYHVVGRPIDQSKLMELAKELGVSDHVVFHGSVKEHSLLWSYYNEADIFILLSENQPNGDVEGFGIVALEANALGTPVIGAKYCGVEEAIWDKNTGVLVDGNNPSEIIDAIEFCLENKIDLEKSCKIWADEHNWELVATEFIKLI